MKSAKAALASAMNDILQLPESDLISVIEYPPNRDLGDLAVPCFRFSKALRQNPNDIARTLAAALATNPVVAEATATGGFVNVKLTRAPFANDIIGQACANVATLFSAKRHTGDKVAVDYSAPNIAKPFGVGHLRSTIIGQSLLRLMREDGFSAIGINHLGDWGTQFGKNIAAYLRWGDEEKVKADPIRELFQLYVRFHAEAENNPALNDEGRAWFKKLEDGDPEAVRLWKWFIDESLKSFKKTYDLLGVTFDYYLGESFYSDKMQPVVDELTRKNLLVESDGAEVVDLSAWNMPPCIIRKSDGATIYATRDLASADYRHNELGATHLIYVVGAEQTLHFQQVFKVLERMGRDYAVHCRHVAFGMMKYNGERLSTRRGKVVYLEEVLERAITEATRIIEEKNPNLADKDKTAEMIGIGAVVFNDLKTYRMHDVDFRYEDVLNFDGETGPYVQYTHARACSVLRKAQSQNIQTKDTPAFSDVTDTEWGLVHTLAQANECFERAIDDMDPSVMARFALQVCHSFNRFYHDNPILGAADGVRAQRIALTDATRAVLAHALYLIGVASPTAM